VSRWQPEKKSQQFFKYQRFKKQKSLIFATPFGDIPP